MTAHRQHDEARSQSWARRSGPTYVAGLLTLALVGVACGGTQAHGPTATVADPGAVAADGFADTTTTGDAGLAPTTGGATVPGVSTPAPATTTAPATTGSTNTSGSATVTTPQATAQEPAPAAQEPAPTTDAPPAAEQPAPVAEQPPAATGDNGGATDVGVSAQEIKLGSISGVNTPLGNIVAAPVTTAVIAAMRGINDGGGIHGRFLNVVDCDDAGDVTRFRACYRKLVEQDQIFSFITSITWGTGEVHGDLERDQVPWVGSWGFYTSEHRDPWMFPVHLASIHEAHTNAQWVRDNIQPETVGVLYLNSPEQHLALAAMKEVLDPAGIEVVREIPQEIATADESGNVLSMRGADPDHIIHFSWPPPIVKFMVDAAAQGYWPTQGMSGNHFLGEVIGDLVGDWPLQSMWTISSYEIWGDEYLAVVDKYAPQMRERHHHITQSGFIGVQVFADAAEAVGPNLTRDELMSVLESREWDAGPGLGQSFLWSPGNHDNIRCEYMFKYNSSETGSYQVYVPDPQQYEVCDEVD